MQVLKVLMMLGALDPALEFLLFVQVSVSSYIKYLKMETSSLILIDHIDNDNDDDDDKLFSYLNNSDILHRSKSISQYSM